MTDTELRIRVDSREVDKGKKSLNDLADSGGKAERSTKSLASANDVLAKAAKAALGAVSALAVIRFSQQSINDARLFGSAIAEVSTLLDDLDQMPRIEREAAALTKQFGGTPTAQAKAYYQAISAGAEDAAEATDILTAANKLAIGGVTDITTSVDGLTTILNSYELEADKATDVSDAMFVAMRAGKTTIGELSSAVGRVTPLASTAGVAFDELLASVAALTTGGMATSEAVTGVRAVLTNIVKPSKEATDAAEELGLGFDLAAIKANGLQGFLEDVVDKTGGSEQAITELFGSTEALNAILSLTGSTAGTFSDIMENMEDRAGQTDRAFGLMSENMDFKLNQLSGKFNTAKVEFGQFLLQLSEPIIDDLNENFDDYMLTLQNLVTGTKDTAKEISEAWKPYAEDVSETLKILDKNWGIYFSNIETGSLNTSEVMQVTFSTALSGIRYWIQRDTVEVASFFDRLALRMRMQRATSEELEAAMQALDRARILSLEDILKQYQNNTSAAYERIKAGQQERETFISLNGSVTTVTTSFGELTDATYEAWVAMMEGRTHITEGFVGPMQQGSDAASDLTEKEQDLIAALEQKLAMMGLSAREQAIMNEVTKLGSKASEEAIARVRELTGAIYDQEVAFEVASAEIDYHANMVENVQREWANLIDTFIDGESDIGDFFDTFAKGIKRVIAEAAAADLANLVFGGGNGGNLMNLLGAGGTGQSGGSGGVGLGDIASLASGGLSLSGIASGIGGFAEGAFGFGQGAAGFMGPMTQSASMGANFSAFLTSGPGLVLLAGLAGKMIHDATNDPDGYHRGMAGFLAAPTPGAPAGSQFDLQAAASGFAPTGFADGPASRQQATAIWEQFRFWDQTVVDALKGTGATVSLANATLGGFGVEGTGSGTFFGRTQRTTDAQFQTQIDSYVKQLAGHIEGLAPETMAQLMGATSAQKVVDILTGLTSSTDDSTAITDEAARTFVQVGNMMFDSNGALVNSNGEVIASDAELAGILDAMPREMRENVEAALMELNGLTEVNGMLFNSNGDLVDSNGQLIASQNTLGAVMAQLPESIQAAISAAMSSATPTTAQLLPSGYAAGQTPWGFDYTDPATMAAINAAITLPSAPDPLYAPVTRLHGSHATGLDYVPFDGYTMQAHKGERVKTAAASRDEDRIAQEVRNLGQRFDRMHAEQRKANASLKKLSDSFTRVTRDGDAMRTTAA